MILLAIDTKRIAIHCQGPMHHTYTIFMIAAEAGESQSVFDLTLNVQKMKFHTFFCFYISGNRVRF